MNSSAIRETAKKRRTRGPREISREEIESDIGLDLKLFVQLSFDILSSTERRISLEQGELKTELGPHGPEFDCAMHALTDKLLFENVWFNTADLRKVLYNIVVSDARICSPEYFQKWEKTSATHRGKTGAERWVHYLSGKKSGLLASRRLYALFPTPAVLFGCLSSLLKFYSDISKNLVSKQFSTAELDQSSVFIQPVPFGGKMFSSILVFSCTARIAVGAFFGIHKIVLDATAGTIKVKDGTDYPDFFDGYTKVDDFVDYNPFSEMLRVCSSFERRIISVCKRLAESGFFENFDKELTPTMKAMVEDFTGREVQNLSYWEIVGLVEKLDDMVSNVYEDRNESDSIFSTLRDITADELYKCRQEFTRAHSSFKENAWYSDLHFFFAYFRGLTASNEMSINPWFEIDPATLVTKERSLQSFLSQFSWDGMYDWLQFGAMVVHLPAQAGFFLAMTAEQHRTCFLSLKKSVLQYPSSEQYRSHFKRLWENGMNTANEEISEASWRTLGRVLSPLYFGSRDWVPIIPARLRKLHADHWTEGIKDTLDMSPAPRQRRQGKNHRHSSEEDEEEDVSEGEDSEVDSYEEYDDDEEEEDDDVDSAVGLLDSDEDSFVDKKSRKTSGNTSTIRFNAKNSAKNVKGRQSGSRKKQPRSSQERQQSAQHQKKKSKTEKKAG